MLHLYLETYKITYKSSRITTFFICRNIVNCLDLPCYMFLNIVLHFRATFESKVYRYPRMNTLEGRA